MKNFLKLIRVEQYIKNLFVFAPLFFGKEFFNLIALKEVFMAFLCYSLAASSIYILNDIYDIEEDKIHPEKSKRPLAAGLISKKRGVILMGLLMILALLFSITISINLFFVLISYVILNILYSKWLKHIAILDINIIAIGFILRILAGASVCNVLPSIWILLMTYILALFLALSKRRTDVVLAENGKKVRKNIDGYNLIFIDLVLGILASILIICYIFYCISPENQKHYNSKILYTSILFVINGVIRYLKLALVDKSTYSPTKIVLNDLFIQITIVFWLIEMSYLLYFNS